MIILDSSALLASIFEEKGSEKVLQITQETFQKGQSIFIHQINFIEVIYKISSRFSEEKVAFVLSKFRSPWWGIVNYLDLDLSLVAAELKKKYLFLSLGDSIGLAWTKINTGTFWTTDKILAEVGQKEQIDVQLIR